MATFNYIVCTGTSGQTTITLSGATSSLCALAYEWWENEYLNQRYFQDFTFYLNNSVNAIFDVNYTITTVITMNGNPYYSGTSTYAYPFPANQTSSILLYECTSYIADGGGNIYVTNRTVEVIEQTSIPSCAPLPPGCALAITGYTKTDVSVRGDSDGSIAIGASGYTGSSSSVYWYLDGIVQSPAGASYVFTGLTAGFYDITVRSLGGCFDQQLDIEILDGEFRTGPFFVIEPEDVTAVENPIVLQLSTAVANVNPLQSINTFTISGSTITGITINFALTFPSIYNAVFQSKGFPDRSNFFLETILTNEIGTPVGTNTITEVATSLAEAFQSDSVLSQLYFINNSGTTITLQSKEFGNQYDLNSGNTTVTGVGVVRANTQSGVVQFDGQLVSNYSLYVELFTNPDLEYGATPNLADYQRVAELELPFNNENIHTFDLSTVLKNFVSSPKIDFTFTGFTTIPSMDTTYFAKYGEKYPLIENTNTKKKRYKGVTDVLYCLNSALDFEDYNTMSGYTGVNISGSTYTGITFMNVSPNPKFIPRGSKEFLYFLLKTQYPLALSLKGDIYFYNGTSQTGITFFTISTLTGATNFGGVTVLACGYDELGLAAYESSGNTKIRRVDFAVWQTSGSTRKLTEDRSYLLEIDEQPQKFDVAFLNKLGTYETFSFVGEVVESEDVTRLNYQVPFSIGSKGQAQKGFQYNSVYDTQYTKLWTVNSGTVDEDTYYYLMGLLQSNRIFNYSNEHENFLTVQSQTASKSSNSAEYTVQVQFKETIYENNVER